MKPYKLSLCAEACEKNNVSCPVEDCRHWINYEEDRNCVLIAVEKNGSMTLDEVGKRVGVSLVSIKKIQDKVARRLKNNPFISVFRPKK